MMLPHNPAHAHTKTYMQTFFIHNSRKLDTTQVSINRCAAADEVYLCRGLPLSSEMSYRHTAWRDPKSTLSRRGTCTRELPREPSIQINSGKMMLNCGGRVSARGGDGRKGHRQGLGAPETRPVLRVAVLTVTQSHRVHFIVCK